MSKKVPLQWAATLLSDAMDQIDAEYAAKDPGEPFLSGDPVDRALVKHLELKQLELGAAVDRRIYFLQYLEDQVTRAKANRDHWSNFARRCEQVLDRVERFTLEAIETNPNIAYRGEFGELKRQKNGQAKLETDLLLATKSVSGIVDLEQIERLAVTDRYLDKIVFITLNKEALRVDLAKGIELPWARLNQNFHLRIRP